MQASVTRPNRHRIGVRFAAFVTTVALALSVPFSVPAPAQADKLSDLKSQLASLRKEVQAASDSWDAAQTRLEATQGKIKSVNARMKVEEKNLAAAETVLGSRADAMYRGGGQTQMVEFVLGAASWEELVSRLDYVTLIASSDAALVKTVKETRARLERNKRDYSKALVVQAQDAAVAKKKTNAMDAAFAAKKSQYDRLLADIAAEYARTNPGRGSYPPGPNGMVFPVQGPNSYSNSWGAPRSGGRTHKGADIMARTGTPCVATTNGTVRSKSNSLGGLTIYLTGDNGWVFYYAHLNSYVVRSGRVKAGQLIGYVGSTGNAKGGAPHLHFQMGPRGNWVNPYSYLRAMQ